ASATQVNLGWGAATDNVGVTAYDVYRNAGLIASLGVATNYNDTTVSPSTPYNYQVKARDAANNTSAASNTAALNPPADTTAPSAPSGLSASAPNATHVSLHWT